MNGNLLSEEKEGSVNFDGMGNAMIEMGLPEKKEDFVKRWVFYTLLEGEDNHSKRFKNYQKLKGYKPNFKLKGDQLVIQTKLVIRKGWETGIVHKSW